MFIEVTDGTQNRANPMPTRHSPPPVAETDTEAAEKLKRPKRNGSTKTKNGLEHLLTEEIAPPTHLSPPLQLAAPDEIVEISASLPPLSDTLDGNSPASDAINVTAAEGFDQVAASKNGLIVVNGIEFHHQSEAEFASLLTYYGIEWLYEPHQFPLQWRDDRVIEMFTPDFYLVEYDFYIELTTMRQSLVRRKNRKLRLLRALYPEINIKLLYRRDYNRLLERFGIKPEEAELEQSMGSEAGE